MIPFTLATTLVIILSNTQFVRMGRFCNCVTRTTNICDTVDAKAIKNYLNMIITCQQLKATCSVIYFGIQILINHNFQKSLSWFIMIIFNVSYTSNVQHRSVIFMQLENHACIELVKNQLGILV